MFPKQRVILAIIPPIKLFYKSHPKTYLKILIKYVTQFRGSIRDSCRIVATNMLKNKLF